MKKIFIYILLAVFSLTACTDLDLNPLDQGSSESWYSSEIQFEMAINDFYRLAFWYYTPTPHEHLPWSDDYTCRDNISVITAGTLNSRQVSLKLLE